MAETSPRESPSGSSSEQPIRAPINDFTHVSKNRRSYVPVVHSFMYRMPTRQVRIREDHHRFVKDEAFTLSGLVQTAIDEVIENNRELPTETDRSTEDHKLIRTSVSVSDEHDDFIASHDFVFSVFVHQLIEDRIELKRKLDELGDQ
ncbi:hypothetical protein [Natrarchaeobius oligotrophus]|uniref:hypothetical protein n=1 Tax=Natrarchaeobius oligotrophus TaxID=3455743 RepID=UPI001404DEF6|nr:hypothetical protein [Natrarchaeobius chitinivorans]